MNLAPFLALALLALIFLQSLNATSVSLNLLRTVRDPLTIIDARILNPVVKFGDDLTISQTYRIKTSCRVDVDRFILKLPEKLIVRRERLPSGAALIGEDETIQSRIPTKSSSVMEQAGGKTIVGEAELVIGSEYVLRQFAHSDCGDRLHSVDYPDLVFKVVE